MHFIQLKKGFQSKMSWSSLTLNSLNIGPRLRLKLQLL